MKTTTPSAVPPASRTNHAAALLAAVFTTLSPLSLTGAIFGDFTYVDNGTSITITDFPDTFSGAVTIPATIDGKPVTAIGDNAFAACSSVSSVTIPSGVTSIGNGAFDDCWDLAGVTIPSSVTDIGMQAFSSCFDLNHVTIPNGVTSIRNGTFEHCFDLADVKIPSSVTSIGEDAFVGCDSLTTVKIPPGVTSIGSYAFALSDGLLSVSLPSSVTTLGNSVFWSCGSLVKATIGGSITSDFYRIFAECGKLKSATFLGNAPPTVTEPFIDAAAGFMVYYYEGKTGFTWPTWQGYPTTPIGPEITVQQPLGSFLVDGTSKTSFGSVRVGKKGVSRKYTIKNIGTQDLTGFTITRNGAQAKDFVVTKPASTSLAPGASTVFKVTFKPKAKGTRKAAIHIKNNDANENPFDIKLTGMGVK